MPRRRAGFSLIEVLVALAVTAVIAVGVLGALSGMASHLTRYREDTQLALLMKALAADIRLRGMPRVLGASFDTHPDYTWEVEELPLDESLGDDPLRPRAREIRLTVTSPSGHSFTARMNRP